MRKAASLIVFALLVWGSDLQATEIQAMGGNHSEDVVSITRKAGRLVVKTARRTLPLDSIKSIRFRPATPANNTAKLVLLGGDSIRAAIEGGDEDAVGIKSEALGSRPVPLELVRAILPTLDPARERTLLGLLREDAALDWVRLKNGGTVKGSISTVDGTRVAIDTDAEGGSSMGEMAFDFAKIELISIAPLDDPPPPIDSVHVVLRLTDGSSLTGVLENMAGGRVTLKHPLGDDAPLVIPAAKVSELIVRGGQFVYLSDLEPAKVKQSFPPEYTYEVDIWGYKRDTNVTGGKLRLGGRTYEKGLGVHSYCELSYELGGRFGEFKSVIGLDDSTRYLGEPGFGAVVFQVYVDGKPAPEYPTGIVKRKGEKPTNIKVDVSGKSSLTLIAGFDPTSLHVLGRANWADAHLIRKR